MEEGLSGYTRRDPEDGTRPVIVIVDEKSIRWKVQWGLTKSLGSSPNAVPGRIGCTRVIF